MFSSRLRLMTVVGTRPEIIRLSEIIRKCDRYFDHILLQTGQNHDYTLNGIFFRDLGLREPDFNLNAAGENPGQTIGNVISSCYEVMAEMRPDAVLVLGDTNSCLSVIAAKRLRIPVFHIEAGNRCKDENLPEEVIRRIVDVTSDVNLCYSEHARRNILASGVRPEYTFVVGSPMPEVIDRHRAAIEKSDILERLRLQPQQYILLSAHREENIDIESNFISLMEAVNRLAEAYGMSVIYSCHPRSRKSIEKREFRFHRNVMLHEPFGFLDYNKLQMNAFSVVSDSGTLPEESAILHFPAVSVRTSTERQEAVDRGVFVIGSITSDSIIQAVEMAVEMQSNGYRPSPVEAYTDINVSDKVVRIIQSYTPIINRHVWHK